MREKHRPDMSEEEAVALLHECLKVGGNTRGLLVPMFAPALLSFAPQAAASAVSRPRAACHAELFLGRRPPTCFPDLPA
jgi:hypothetical protein